MTEMEQQQVLLLRQEKDALMVALTNVVNRNEEDNQRTRALLSKLMAEMRAEKMAEHSVMEQGDIIPADFGGDDVLVKISDTDTTAGYLATKLLPGTGINFTPNPHSPGNQTITINADPPDPPTDELIKISADDTTADYLGVKLLPGTNITFTPDPQVPGNQSITINAAGADSLPWMCKYILADDKVTLTGGWVSAGRQRFAVSPSVNNTVTDGDCWGIVLSYSSESSTWTAAWVKYTKADADGGDAKTLWEDGEEDVRQFYYEFALNAGVASIAYIGAMGNWKIPSSFATE
jgi:hypothetical protein